MPLFAFSDTHLSLSLDKPMDVFGCRWTDYVSKLEKGWKAVVSPDDTVIVGGDISWGMTLDEAKEDLLFLDRLPGKKIISKGNHDYWWSSLAKINNFFAENGINTISLLHNNAFAVENKIICGSRGWFNEEKNCPRNADHAKIVAREALRIGQSIKEGFSLKESGNQDNELIVFLHFPPVFKDEVCREIIDVLKQYGIKKVYYGHIHGVYNIPADFEFEGITFSICSADYLNFVPLLVR